MLEKKISTNSKLEKDDTKMTQQEMYKKMQKTKSTASTAPPNIEIKKPVISSLINKLKQDISNKPNRYELDNDTSNRIKVTDTIDSDDVSTDINVSKLKTQLLNASR